MSLSNLTALVTGASKGIGAAVCRALAEEGATVFAMARSANLLADLEERSGCHPIVGDVTREADLARAVDVVSAESGGPPDLVVSSAGVFDLAPLAETPTEVLDRNLDVNLRGAFLLVRAVLPGMLERGSGLIVTVGSVAGRTAFPGNAAYSASKFGVRGMHEVLLEEIRGSGVRATLLEPGACDTPIWDDLEPDAREDLPDRGQMLRPRDVAEAVVFLASRPADVQVPLLLVQRA
jgi:NAD(P)-dependent dehydrogenase (short-subunit alcohol dehydrogenase family)